MVQLSRRRALLALSGLALPALPAGRARAQSLGDLRASGKVGERYDGFAVARDPSVESFVASVNSQRRQQYEQIAAQQGTSVEQVGRVAAQEIISRLPSGAWVLTEGGWAQR